jgi:hypothetical protein
LNRVVGQDPSSILGALQSNGRVFLINPNGIVFGPSAQIDVAGLVASTLNLSDADFLAGRLRFTEVPGAGAVVNQGAINAASGGQVYLVGSSVKNEGLITSPNGEVVLAAGNSVELVNAGTPNLRVEISAPDNEARNLGTIVADAGRVGIYAGLINHSGTIRADSAVSEGGRIVLKATKNATLESSSVISAAGSGGGRIDVLAGDRVEVAGRLDASAPNDGDGGFIETSARKVTVADGTVVTTSAPFGKTGTWLIDPPDFFIAAAGGDMTGAALSSSLGSGNVVITSDGGEGGLNGDIFVNDAVSWNSANSLALLARRNVEVNRNITNNGSGDINLYAGWTGASTESPAVTPGTGDILVNNATVQTGGNVLFTAGRDIKVTNSNNTVHAGFGTPTANRSVIFDAGRDILVSGSVIRATTDTSDEVDSTSLVALKAAGNITVSGSTLEAGQESVRARQANVELESYGGNILVQSGSTLRAWGRHGDMFNDEPPGLVILQATGAGKTITLSGATVTSSGMDASVLMSAPGGITINDSTLNVTSLPGNDGTAMIWGCAGAASPGPSCAPSETGTIAINNSSLFASGNIGVVGAARIDFRAGSDITVSNSSLNAVAGAGGFGTGGYANIELYGSSVNVSSSQLIATGGDASDGDGGNVAIYLTAFGSGGVSVSSSTIRGTGGFGGGDGGECYYCGFGGDVSVRIGGGGGGPVTVSGSTVEALGGGGAYRGGDAYVYSDEGVRTITVENSTVRAIGGTGGAYNGWGTVAFADYASNIAISGSTIRADGAEGSIQLYAPYGNISINGSTLAATGNQYGANVEIYAGNNVEIGTSAATTISAVSSNGSYYGTFVDIRANGSVTMANAVVSAIGTGGEGFGGGQIDISAYGNVQLGLLETDVEGAVYVNSWGGAITDGNVGLNIGAPYAELQAWTGIGSIANPLETLVGQIYLSNNSGEVGIINTGNLVLQAGGGFDASAAAIQTSGSLGLLSPIGISGDLGLLAGTNFLVDQNVSAGGDLILGAGGSLNVSPNSSPLQVSGANVLLVGGSVNIGSASAGASTDVVASGSGFLGVAAAGDFNVLGGSASGAYAFVKGLGNSVTINTGGNVNVIGGSGPGAFAHVQGSPDVLMNVGGVVNMSGTSGAPGRIESASPITISLAFPNLASGGYFVNGQEGVVADPQLGTGFYADGSPAVLGVNLLVSYGGAPATPPPSTVESSINQVIVAINQQIEITETAGTQGEGPEAQEEEKKKKELPVCR